MGQNILVAFIVVLIICIFWSWYMLANPPKLLCSSYDDLKFKTGDMILFHAYDNINPVFMGSYWGHVGIVYDDPKTDKLPVLFEAARTSKMKNCPVYNKHGIMVTDLKTRLEKYKGLVACKFLNRSVSKIINDGFINLMKYAKKNMYYNDDVIYNGLKKRKGEKLNVSTNCGELVMLSLVKLGLIPEQTLNEKIAHHLLYVAHITKLQNNYYLKPVEISFNPF
jgi:hypothetical protein